MINKHVYPGLRVKFTGGDWLGSAGTVLSRKSISGGYSVWRIYMDAEMDSRYINDSEDDKQVKRWEPSYFEPIWIEKIEVIWVDAPNDSECML